MAAERDARELGNGSEHDALTAALGGCASDVDGVMRTMRQLRALTDQESLAWEMEEVTATVVTLLFTSEKRFELGTMEYKQLCENLALAKTEARPDGIRVMLWRPSWILGNSKGAPPRATPDMCTYRDVDRVQALPKDLSPAERDTVERLIHLTCNISPVQRIPELRIELEEGDITPRVIFSGFDSLDMDVVTHIFRRVCTRVGTARVVVVEDKLELEFALNTRGMEARLTGNKRERALSKLVKTFTRRRTSECS